MVRNAKDKGKIFRKGVAVGEDHSTEWSCTFRFIHGETNGKIYIEVFLPNATEFIEE